MSAGPRKERVVITSPSKYLALHLRFEVDMVAYSMCHFGGGKNERRELQAYREEHFPLVLERLKKMRPVSPTELRKMGRYPLTPEEAAVVLAGLGFDRGTYIYLAGSEIYGGRSGMHPLISLYPNVVTKEDLLSPSELAPFRNFSSQVRVQAICGLPLFCKDTPEHLSKIVDILAQLLTAEENVERDAVHKALLSLLRQDVRASLTSLFKHIECVDEQITDENLRERTLLLIRDKVFPLKPELLKPSEQMERHITDLIKRSLQAVTGVEFKMFMDFLKSLSMFGDKAPPA